MVVSLLPKSVEDDVGKNDVYGQGNSNSHDELNNQGRLTSLWS